MSDADSIPPKAKVELKDIRLLMAGYHLVGQMFKPLVCANAALNYAVQVMCAAAVAEGSTQESVEQWADEAGKALKEAVRANFETSRKVWEQHQAMRDKANDN